MTKLECYIDFKSPAAYLALQPTLELAADFDIQLIWHPYNTTQKTVPAAHEDESKGETHIRVRALARRHVHLKYAALRGLPMTFPDPPGSTDVALAALLSWPGCPLKFIEQAFHAYWVDHADLNDKDTVLQLIRTSSGHSEIGEAELTSSLAKLESFQLAAEAAGIVDAPAYILEEQIFIGREHMPWMRQMLAGR